MTQIKVGGRYGVADLQDIAACYAVGMRQVLYVSTSLIGDDIVALDRMMVEAQTNNALDGITGLLWTDGQRFAQVIEGGDAAIGALIERLPADPRHRDFEIVDDHAVVEREFGGWAMLRPSSDPLAAPLEARMVRHLSTLTGPLGQTFAAIIAGSRSRA